LYNQFASGLSHQRLHFLTALGAGPENPSKHRKKLKISLRIIQNPVEDPQKSHQKSSKISSRIIQNPVEDPQKSHQKSTKISSRIIQNPVEDPQKSHQKSTKISSENHPKSHPKIIEMSRPTGLRPASGGLGAMTSASVFSSRALGVGRAWRMALGDDLPSENHHFEGGKSAISMVIFNSCLMFFVCFLYVFCMFTRG